MKIKSSYGDNMEAESLTIPNDIDCYCKDFAKPLQVVPYIHPQDFIYHFLINNPSFPSTKDAINYYFNDGSRSANMLSDLIYENLGFQRTSNLKLLEFASGYGCVTRHLSNHLSSAQVTSCDIHNNAVNFIRSHLSTDAIISQSSPEELIFEETYDIIFALSFFSHMPRKTWGQWIKKLYSGLNEGGYLIFTTHGKKSAHFLNCHEIPSDGFWFKLSSEQLDLDTEEYGLTLVTAEYVIEEVYHQIKAPIVMYREGFWWSHQDLYIIEKV
jgi:hypothetical protein